MVDFGDDALTRGRPHPMIDPTLRDQQLRRAAADPAPRCVLLDVVLGHGAQPDPAAELAPAIVGRRRLPVVVSADRRPTRPAGPGRARRAGWPTAGAEVFTSNAAGHPPRDLRRSSHGARAGPTDDDPPTRA